MLLQKLFSQAGDEKNIWAAMCGQKTGAHVS
jgi:hypothetical protein